MADLALAIQTAATQITEVVILAMTIPIPSMVAVHTATLVVATIERNVSVVADLAINLPMAKLALIGHFQLVTSLASVIPVAKITRIVVIPRSTPRL